MLLAAALILLNSLSVKPQLIISFCLKGIGNEAVRWIDLHIASTREVGVVLEPLYMLASQCVGLDCASLELALNLESYRQSHRRHKLNHQVCYRGVDNFARNRLADSSAAAHRHLLTKINWDHATTLMLVTHTHALAAQATHDTTLE